MHFNPQSKLTSGFRGNLNLTWLPFLSKTLHFLPEPYVSFLDYVIEAYTLTFCF